MCIISRSQNIWLHGRTCIVKLYAFERCEVYKLMNSNWSLYGGNVLTLYTELWTIPVVCMYTLFYFRKKAKNLVHAHTCMYVYSFSYGSWSPGKALKHYWRSRTLLQIIVYYLLCKQPITQSITKVYTRMQYYIRHAALLHFYVENIPLDLLHQKDMHRPQPWNNQWLMHIVSLM